MKTNLQKILLHLWFAGGLKGKDLLSKSNNKNETVKKIDEEKNGKNKIDFHLKVVEKVNSLIEGKEQEKK